MPLAFVLVFDLANCQLLIANCFLVNVYRGCYAVAHPRASPELPLLAVIPLRTPRPLRQEPWPLLLPSGLPVRCGLLPIAGCLAVASLDLVLDFHIRGRDRDRAVQRSPALEGLHQLPRFVVTHTGHAKLQAHGVE